LTKELLAGLARFKIQHGFENPEMVLPNSPAPKEPGTSPLDSVSVQTRKSPSPTSAFSGATERTSANYKEGRAATEDRIQFRLHGKGGIIVLAEERSVSEELLGHPEILRQLIQSGLLFAVSDGTPVEVIETRENWTRVAIMEGQMRGRLGWIASKQVQPWR
jgi:hypothetical protein